MGRHTVKQVFKKRLSFIDSSLGDAAFTAPAEQAKQAPVGPEECLPAPALPDRVSGFLLSFFLLHPSFFLLPSLRASRDVETYFRSSGGVLGFLLSDLCDAGVVWTSYL